MKLETLKWFSEKLSSWLSKNYNITSELIDNGHNVFEFALTYGSNTKTFYIDDEDINEIEKAIENDTKDIVNNENIRYIFQLNEKTFISFFHCQLSIESTFKKFTFYLDKSRNKKLQATISNKVNYTILIIIINQEGILKFNKEKADENLNEVENWLDLFSINNVELNTLEITLDLETITQVFLSFVFECSMIIKFNLIPFGISFKLLKDIGSLTTDLVFNLEAKKNDQTKIHQISKYHLDALIYYFAAHQNLDNRFKFLDFYHVLEFYFDKILFEKTLNILDEKLKDPRIYYDENEREKLAKMIKDEYYHERDVFKEKVLLQKVLDKYIESTYFNEFIIKQKKLSNIKSLNLKECDLQKIEKEKALSSNITDRIWSLRNSIAHSKSDNDVRVKPNTKGLSDINNDITLMSNISEFLILSFKTDFE